MGFGKRKRRVEYTLGFLSSGSGITGITRIHVSELYGSCRRKSLDGIMVPSVFEGNSRSLIHDFGETFVYGRRGILEGNRRGSFDFKPYLVERAPSRGKYLVKRYLGSPQNLVPVDRQSLFREALGILSKNTNVLVRAVVSHAYKPTEGTHIKVFDRFPFWLDDQAKASGEWLYGLVKGSSNEIEHFDEEKPLTFTSPSGGLPDWAKNFMRKNK